MGRLGRSVWAVSLALIASAAAAHMPYLAPSVFDAGERKSVSLVASFSEDPFRPELAMTNAPFEITGPDGVTKPLPAQAVLADATILQAALPADGLYRVSSGQRLGRMNKMFRKDGAWVLVEDGVRAPAGAVLVDAQSTTLADVYVLRGKAASRAALAPRGKALEIRPLGDPAAVGAGEAAAFELLYQGKPLVGATVSLFREAGFYDGKKMAGDMVSDGKGKITLTAPDAGRYLLLVRHRDAAPAGAAAPYYSYTATLAFEAM